MQRPILLLVFNVLCFFLVDTGLAHEGEALKALLQEMESLKAQNREMQQEWQAMKALLKPSREMGLESPPELHLGIQGKVVLGDSQAKLTIIEFTDYECPFCRKHVIQTMPSLEKEYIQTGKVQYIIRDFPLEAIHKTAFHRAVVANCAGEQNRYWEMHDRLFVEPVVVLDSWEQHATALGLDLPAFQECVRSERQAEKVRKDIQEGREAGVKGTPTFFLGFQGPDQHLKVMKVLRGAQSYTRFKNVIDQLLADGS